MNEKCDSKTPETIKKNLAMTVREIARKYCKFVRAVNAVAQMQTS
jgi:hypothetical protein